MTTITKTIEYGIPDKWMTTTTTAGKSSTQEYVGPANLILWIDKDTNEVEEVYDAVNMTERPTPLNYVQVEMDCNEMTTHCGFFWGGFEEPAHFEVENGPTTELNPTVADPTHPSEVYDIYSFTRGYNQETGEWGAIAFSTPDDDDLVTPEMIRANRNSLLQTSDANVAADMPEGIATEWATYRQKLRDLPDNWDLTKPHLIVLPKAPDEDNANSEIDCLEGDGQVTASYTTVIGKADAKQEWLDQL